MDGYNDIFFKMKIILGVLYTGLFLPPCFALINLLTVLPRL